MCAYTKFIIHFCLINNLMIFKKIHLYIYLNISINVHIKIYIYNKSAFFRTQKCCYKRGEKAKL